MGMARVDYTKRRRPQWSHKLWWCEDCDAQFSGNDGGWIKVLEYSNGTAPAHRREKLKDIPAHVCIMCESKNIHGPIE